MTRAGRPGTVQSVERALRVLEAVGSHRQGMSAKAIAAELGLTLPTTYHLLVTLVDAGYVLHERVEHRYVLGHRVRELSVALGHQLSVPPAVAAAVRSLHVRADAAAYYAVFRDEAVVVSHVEDSPRRPRMVPLGVGFHEVPHATAFGKVMLAAMSPAARRRALGTGLRCVTAATLVDRVALEAQLERVRETRLAWEVEELQAGWACLASPVHSPGGAVVAAVSVSVPVAEYPARRQLLETVVRESATRTTRALAAG